MASKRLRSDLLRLTKDPPPGVTAGITDDGNLFTWDAMICGPGDTPFEGGTFRLRLEFPPDYPQKAPVVTFFSKMFHPNVYPNGRICLDILEEPDKWKSEYDAASILAAIQAMLGEPNPESPANGEANILFKTNMEEYETRVQSIVLYSEKFEDGQEGLNLNAAHEEDVIRERVNDLDLSGIAGEPEEIRQFLQT